MKSLKIIGAVFGIILLIIILIILAFAMEFGGLKWKQYFAPKHEAVRREVFKETRSFNEAKMQELLKLRLEYIREKDTATKEALAFTIRHKFADYDENKLPYELKVFLGKIKYSK